MTKKLIIIPLVAHVTVRGLESLKRGRIDLSDPRLDGELGTVQLELITAPSIVDQMEHEIRAAQALFGNEGALKHLDEAFIIPGRVEIVMATSGRADVDSHIRSYAAQAGRIDFKVGVS